ncbi:hypothetical protein [Leptospira biflexa]|uniref:hypothetical protein n=1 Tax=Leptospira biflexa TaxID=172 RepID=UPI0010917696|nr:hypothetical protein [Leptospira biflexa]TGM45294.1 hypothetical protein EHQ88_13905 [Leptospira biflexa]
MNKIIFILIPLIASFIVLFTSLAYIYWFSIKLNKQISTSPEDWAHFGDFFGGIISSILTYLTLLTVILTLYYQKEELSLTRKELEESRRISNLQEMSLRSQAISQRKSLFESAFMQMIEIHFKLLDSYKKDEKDGGQNFIENIVMLTKLLKNNNEYDFRNLMDIRMHRHLFHFASIVDLIYQNESLNLDEKKYYLNITKNIIGDTVIEFIRIAYHLPHLNKIREQLLQLCSDVV